VTVIIDEEYQRKMLEFQRRINKREAVVGWFTTTTAADNQPDTYPTKNNYYSKLCKKPIIVTVDTALTSADNFSIRVFVDKKIGLEGEDFQFADSVMELKMKVTILAIF